MRKAALFALVAVVIVCTSSWAQQSPGMSAADIEKFNASFAAAWATGDGEAVAGHYAPDAVRVGSTSANQVGRAAIQQYFSDFLTGTGKGSKIALRTTGSRALSADTMIVYGTFDVTGPGARSGRYLNTVVRQSSGWVIASSASVFDQTPAK